jgi:hypothetical protein
MIIALLILNTLLLLLIVLMVWIIGDRQATIHKDKHNS